MTPRGYPLALAGLAAGGVLALVGYARPWAVARPEVGGLRLPDVTVDGAAAYPPGPALGVVLIAGAVAVLATRGLARRLVGLVLLAAAVAVAAGGAAFAGSGAARAAAVVAGTPGLGAAAVGEVATTSWWLLVVAGGALAGVAAGAVLVRGPRWPGLSARYDRTRGAGPSGVPGQPGRPGAAGPAAPPSHDTAATRSAAPPTAASPPTAAAVWDALDRGEDPTRG